MKVYNSQSEAETLKIAAEIGKLLKQGDIVALNGELGAGKTVLVKGLVRYFGSSELVTSPTFALVNEYDGDIRIYHFDVYRLENPSPDECDWIDDYLFGDGICLIEWAENIRSIIPKNHVEINIKKKPDTNVSSREITVERF